MTDTSARPASALYLACVYLLTLLGWTIVVLLAITGLDVIFGIEFENSAMGVILVMGAAMTTGHFWYRREGARPASIRMWKIAPLCALMALSVQLALALLVMSMEGQALMKEIGREGPIFAAGIVAGLLLLNFLLIRLGLGLATRQAEKHAQVMADRLAARHATSS